MWVLNEGRKDFLEFLRNLSIQFFLIIIVAILFDKFKPLMTKENLSDGIKMGVLCTLVFAIIVLAVIANVINFFSAFKKDEIRNFENHLLALQESGNTPEKTSRFVYFLKYRKLAFLEACLLMIGMEVVIVLGFAYSSETAQRFISGSDTPSNASVVRSCPPTP